LINKAVLGNDPTRCELTMGRNLRLLPFPLPTSFLLDLFYPARILVKKYMLTGFCLFVLKCNAVSCSIIFAKRIQSTKFIKFIYRTLNVKTCSQMLKPGSYQTHQRKTDRLTPYSRQTQTPTDLIIFTFAFIAARK
jgi:hypothetical protein